MKQLIVSLKSSSEVMSNFKRAFKNAKRKKKTSPHFEVSFDNRKDFERFVKNIHLLSYIQTFKPQSVYELSKICGMDVSNLNKIILFLEEIGAIHIREQVIEGRKVKTPLVEYEKIEFDLNAA